MLYWNELLYVCLNYYTGLVLNGSIPGHLTPRLVQTEHPVNVEMNYSFLNMVHLTGEISNSSSFWGGKRGGRG